MAKASLQQLQAALASSAARQASPSACETLSVQMMPEPAASMETKAFSGQADAGRAPTSLLDAQQSSSLSPSGREDGDDRL